MKAVLAGARSTLTFVHGELMAFPDSQLSIVTEDKLCDYLLNPSHPVGGPKATPNPIPSSQLQRVAPSPHSPLPRAGEGCRRRGEGLMARQDTIGYHCLSGLQSRTSCTRPGGTSNCPELDANTREQCGTPKAAEVEVLIEVVCNAPFAVRRPEH